MAAAQVRRKVRRSLEDCKQAFVKAQRVMDKRDYAGASYYFEQSLACNDQFWAAHLGIGVAELRRGNVAQAVKSMERARDSPGRSTRTTRASYYDLACAKARQNDRKAALANLKTALDLGWDDPRGDEPGPGPPGLQGRPRLQGPARPGVGCPGPGAEREVQGRSLVAPEPSPPPAAKGHRFGNYQVLSLLGKGGMAEVFRARVLSGPRQGWQVAIKRLLP